MEGLILMDIVRSFWYQYQRGCGRCVTGLLTVTSTLATRSAYIILLLLLLKAQPGLGDRSYDLIAMMEGQLRLAKLNCNGET